MERRKVEQQARVLVASTQCEFRGALFLRRPTAHQLWLTGIPPVASGEVLAARVVDLSRQRANSFHSKKSLLGCNLAQLCRLLGSVSHKQRKPVRRPEQQSLCADH